MFALARLLVVLLVVLTVVYICVSLYSRAVRRDKLEAEWDEAQGPGNRTEFVQQGLQDYDGSLRRKLILLIYVVPLTVISAIVYVINFM